MPYLYRAPEPHVCELPGGVEARHETVGTIWECGLCLQSWRVSNDPDGYGKYWTRVSERFVKRLLKDQKGT